MTPLKLSFVWYRRLHEVILLASLVLIALFVVDAAHLLTLPSQLHISIFVALGASVSFIGSLLGFIFSKKTQSFVPALCVYLIFAATVAFSGVANGAEHVTVPRVVGTHLLGGGYVRCCRLATALRS